MPEHKEGGTNVSGNRFEADISPNRSRADIKDRKNNRLFSLMNREDLEELRDLAAELLGMMPE
jgi:hypothetical protein